MKNLDYVNRFKLVKYNKAWAVTETKVSIRQAVAKTPWPHWHLLTFCGRRGSEARGVVDMLAIRKDHGLPQEGTKRGDAFQMILIQVKGGSAANPTVEDGKRLRIVRRQHHAQKVLLAAWKKGRLPDFFSLRPEGVDGKSDWIKITDLAAIFR
jgi:hypothetical protein